ncbi:YqaJ viral recombinase family protein [Corynebacterium macginleyi]|uniref:YqaJ viral recombinase family protein n=1 Tax=Corynebacterium macginleyi TaxID=38290 RepID=UPI003080981A
MKRYEPNNDEEWAQFRLARLTSTELASLRATRTAANWQRIRRLKDTGDSGFSGNQYTGWGSGREPRLAPLVQEVDTRLSYNAEPQTIIINSDDDRLCGTPDLFSDDGEVIGEIKTSKTLFAGGRYHSWCPDQYYLQIQANMWHTGAEACVLLVEYYDEENGDFHPQECDYQTITYDPATVQDLKETAAQWFTWLEEGTAPDWMGETLSLDDVDELEALVEQFADADAKAKTWAELAKQYREEILTKVGESYSATHAGYKVSVSTSKDSKTFDSQAFRTAYPALYSEYNTKTRRGSTRIRLTKDT